jgi:hypothetical protein
MHPIFDVVGYIRDQEKHHRCVIFRPLRGLPEHHSQLNHP